jgi:vacuolar protein sorting-associated protein IST1
MSLMIRVAIFSWRAIFYFNISTVLLKREVDPGLYECIASILWVTPRLESEVSELKVISEELQHKYGKDFVMMCKTNKCEKVNERLMLKMSEQGPGDLLVEKYLVEITKSHNVPFKPDPSVSIRDPDFFYNSMESPSSNKNNNNNSNGHSGNGGSADGPVAVTQPTAVSLLLKEFLKFTRNFRFKKKNLLI